MIRSTSISTLTILLAGMLFVQCQKEIPTTCGGEPILNLERKEYCENTCTFKDDGECDDGGPNSTSTYCDYGTDCNDCSTRVRYNVKD